MSHFQFIDRLKRIDDCVHAEATGSAMQLAKKIGVDRSTIFDYFNHIREKGAEICFDKRRNTYYYKNNFKLSF